MNPRTDRRLAALYLAVAASLVLPCAAQASDLQPLLDTSVVDRVHELVPLGPDGSRIALNASSSTPGRKAGPHSHLARNGIYLAGRDAHGLRLAWAAEEGATIRALTATGDGNHIAFISALLGVAPSVMDTATMKTRRVHGKGASSIDGFVAGSRALFATIGEGRAIRRIDASTGRLLPVPKVGPGSHAKVLDSITRSPDETHVGSCGMLRHGKRRHGLRLGLLDMESGELRVRLTGARAHSTRTCGVSEDGSTVATLGTRGRATTLYATRRGQGVAIRVPRAAVHVASVSPSGRFVLIGGGEDYESQYESHRFVALARMVAVVDLDTAEVSTVHGLSRYVKPRRHSPASFGGSDAVWSPDELHFGMAPSSGGIMLVDTITGGVRFARNPAPPVGFAFLYPSARPRAFSADGQRLVFVLPDKSEDITTEHPYSLPVDGAGPPSYLLTKSMRSFSGTVRSADGSTTWVLPSSTCHSTYPQPLLRVVAGTLYDGPFTATGAPAPAS